MLADAEHHDLPDGPLRDLEVDGVGTIKARSPIPKSAAVLAACSRSKASDAEKLAYLNLFVRNHVGADQHAALLERMLFGTAPPDTMNRVVQAITTGGTARPYRAVITLSVMTAHHWRQLRSKLLLAGIGDPMGLPSMHSLLDLTESALCESMAAGEDGPQKVTEFMDKLYAPEIDPKKAAAGYKPPPSWWDADESEADFDAMMAQAPH